MDRNMSHLCALEAVLLHGYMEETQLGTLLHLKLATGYQASNVQQEGKMCFFSYLECNEVEGLLME